jgi:hypothetical protein
MRKFLAALALAAGLSFGTANAAVVDVGGNAANPIAIDAFSNPLTLGSENAIIGVITGKGVSFTHTISFSLLESAGTGIAGEILETIIGPKKLSDIDDFSFSLINLDTSTTLFTGGDADAAFIMLMAGVNYAVKITGTTSGSVGGKYAINLAVTPVPAAALLLAPALLGLGLVARRRAA